MLALFGTMRPEISSLRRHMALEEAPAEQGCRVYKGEHENREVLLVQTGIGKKRAERATELVLERYPVTALVSFGFGGALTEEAKAGDIVLCSALYCGNNHVHDDTGSGGPCYSDINLISVAAKALAGSQVGLLQGNSVTVDSVVSEPEAKQVLGKIFSAQVVDMESYWIGRVASAKQVPFLAVRAVSDTVADRLPPFGRLLDSNGTWRRKSATLYFLIRPRQLVNLCILYRNARKAGNNLSHIVPCLIPKL